MWTRRGGAGARRRDLRLAGIDHAGGGVLDLTADNTYTGTTEVGDGTLLVDGSQAGSPVTIDSGATLGGIGTVGSITASGGTVSPGDTGPGLFTDSGDLTLQSDASSNNSVFDVELDGSTAGTTIASCKSPGRSTSTAPRSISRSAPVSSPRPANPSLSSTTPVHPPLRVRSPACPREPTLRFRARRSRSAIRAAAAMMSS